jgi:uncharacterized protein YkwD
VPRLGAGQGVSYNGTNGFLMSLRRFGAILASLLIGATLAWTVGCGAGSVVVIPGSGALGGTDSTNPITGGGSQDIYGPGGTDLAADCEAIGQPVDTIHQQMFAALNVYRTNNRLPALKYSKRLEAAADGHARDMWQRHFFEHTNPDGEGPGERALRAGFCHSMVGENIAEGDGLPTVADVQAGWVASPGHNANMLNEPYRLVGMGHYYDPATGYHYWVQDLALPEQ